MVVAHRDLSAPDRAILRATAAEKAAAGADRLLAAEGRAYAAALPVEDLRALVVQVESEPAKRMRAALPQVIAATMQSAGSIDFKKETLAAFCAKTGKACEE